MKKRHVSLALKLNILIVAIILVISCVLIQISYHNYQSAFKPYSSDLKQAEKEVLSHNDEYAQIIKYCTKVFESDEYQEVLKNEDEDAPDTKRYAWMAKQPNRKGEFDADKSVNLFDDLSTLWNTDVVLCESNDLDGICVFGKGKSGLICMDDYNVYMTETNSMGSGDPYNLQLKNEALTNGISSSTFEDGSHTEMMSLVPIKDGDEVVGGVRLYCDITDLKKGQTTSLIVSVLSTLILMLISIIITVLLLRRIAVNPLTKLAAATREFSTIEGNYAQDDVMQLDIRGNDEIGELYHDIQSMQQNIVENTNHLTSMVAEKERISTELDLATKIQSGVLPRTFPPFPERKEIELYASMAPAREVGGDFYDYYLIDDNHLCLVVADVSGKGVPAALFMMACKITIANNAKMGKSPAQILTDVNSTICSDNSLDMFVTVWIGILDLTTGVLTAANAGHEYPILRQPGKAYEVLKDKHGFVLGGIDGVKYTEYEIQMHPGSKLFLYTDGLPEATNAGKEMFGLDRAVAELNKDPDLSVEDTLEHISNAVGDFIQDAEPFDDLTMMNLIYHGKA